jgi:soluble lytic murein transglycosylase-like protein
MFLALLIASSCSPAHRFDSAIAAAVDDVAGVYPVPPALVRAVIQRESAFRPLAVSRAGARGLMQVMPANAARLGISTEDLFDPAKNILAGVRLLAVLLRHYRGDVISSLVAYNARPRRLCAPLPRNNETPEYVRQVLRNYRAFLEERAAAATSLSTPAPATSTSSHSSRHQPKDLACRPTTASN